MTDPGRPRWPDDPRPQRINVRIPQGWWELPLDGTDPRPAIDNLLENNHQIGVAQKDQIKASLIDFTRNAAEQDTLIAFSGPIPAPDNDHTVVAMITVTHTNLTATGLDQLEAAANNFTAPPGLTETNLHVDRIDTQAGTAIRRTAIHTKTQPDAKADITAQYFLPIPHSRETILTTAVATHTNHDHQTLAVLDHIATHTTLHNQ